MTTIKSPISTPGSRISDTFFYQPECAYHCRLWITPDEEGYSVIVASLPGIISEGNTIDEAIEHIREAFSAAMESYIESGMPTPWTNEDPFDKPENTIERWVILNA